MQKDIVVSISIVKKHSIGHNKEVLVSIMPSAAMMTLHIHLYTAQQSSL